MGKKDPLSFGHTQSISLTLMPRRICVLYEKSIHNKHPQELLCRPSGPVDIQDSNAALDIVNTVFSLSF